VRLDGFLQTNVDTTVKYGHIIHIIGNLGTKATGQQQARMVSV
jgi:hypothetical protein